jgi:hypothetical protein
MLHICDVLLPHWRLFIVFFNADELSAGYLRRDACATASCKGGEYPVIGVGELAGAAKGGTFMSAWKQSLEGDNGGR